MKNTSTVIDIDGSYQDTVTNQSNTPQLTDENFAQNWTTFLDGSQTRTSWTSYSTYILRHVKSFSAFDVGFEDTVDRDFSVTVPQMDHPYLEKVELIVDLRTDDGSSGYWTFYGYIDDTPVLSTQDFTGTLSGSKDYGGSVTPGNTVTVNIKFGYRCTKAISISAARDDYIEYVTVKFYFKSQLTESVYTVSTSLDNLGYITSAVPDYTISGGYGEFYISIDDGSTWIGPINSGSSYNFATNTKGIGKKATCKFKTWYPATKTPNTLTINGEKLFIKRPGNISNAYVEISGLDTETITVESSTDGQHYTTEESVTGNGNTFYVHAVTLSELIGESQAGMKFIRFSSGAETVTLSISIHIDSDTLNGSITLDTTNMFRKTEILQPSIDWVEAKVYQWNGSQWVEILLRDY